MTTVSGGGGHGGAAGGSGGGAGARLAREAGVGPERLAGLDPEVARRLDERIRQLREAAELDELTGAQRRAAGLAALEREIRRARRHQDRALVVAFLDVDTLKAVNDGRGHAAGDAILREVVGALHRRLRAYDLVIRWGGDEFVAALSQAGLASAERALSEVAADFSARTSERFSTGFAEIAPGEHAEALVARADADLYERKLSRRERWGDSRQKRQGRPLHSPA